jgi:molybdopterin-containing oxidoreductase family membrane subunit
MWTSSVLAVVSLGMLLFPGIRKREGLLAFAAVALFISLWIDKGFGLIIGGFVPNMLNQVRTYWPTAPEALIALGVWSVGFFVLTILYKVAISVREETAGIEIEH